jgi:type II secretory ATPase GspE/PulE/Tfp pilus assembly ATPase PilB-like protein
MDTASRHRPQEGMFRAGMAGDAATFLDLDFSVTSCPTLAGENMTVRRISPCSPAPDLDELPHSRHVTAALKQVMKHITGMLLVAAPPGNGRAATLYAMLRHIHGPELKAVTVDEAISFSMPEAVQTQANPSLGLSYGEVLRAALRLDPDIILAEDLGDAERAALGLEAVRRGILLLGGINAEDSAAAVSTMAGLGRTAQTTGFFKAVLAQRYVRRICPACKQAYTPSSEEWQPLFERLPKGLSFFRGTGCPECDFTGYRGRILLSELLVITDTIARAMKQQLSENDIRHIMIRSGAKTLIDDGLSKLDETTLSEIVDAVPQEAAEAVKCIRADAPPPSPPPPDNKPAPGEAKTAFGVTLSSEDIPGAKLRQLHHAYEALMEETGRRSQPSNLGDFETFIKAHHSAICRQYGCIRVSFSVERQEGTVLLTARPVM